MKQFVNGVSSFFLDTRERKRGREGEGSVYSGQQTGVIGSKPSVKIQSASGAPEIVTGPPSVGQVPMSDDVSTDSATISVDVSMLPVGSRGSIDEEDKDESEESGHVDDEEDVDDINHDTFPKETVRAHTPSTRERRSTLWKYLSRINKHDVTEHVMKEDCAHVCVYPLSEGEGGLRCYCNQPLKLFRCNKGKRASCNFSSATRASDIILEAVRVEREPELGLKD
jgi:hypothetical protein